MAKFVYKMQSLLNIKLKLEDQAKTAYGLARAALNEEEEKLIRRKMKESGVLQIGAYLRKMAIDGYIVKLELPELKEMTRLLSSHSNNLNQIAKRVNATGNIYATDFDEIQNQQEALWTAAEKIIRTLAKLK